MLVESMVDDDRTDGTDADDDDGDGDPVSVPLSPIFFRLRIYTKYTTACYYLRVGVKSTYIR